MESQLFIFFADEQIKTFSTSGSIWDNLNSILLVLAAHYRFEWQEHWGNGSHGLKIKIKNNFLDKFPTNYLSPLWKSRDLRRKLWIQINIGTSDWRPKATESFSVLSEEVCANRSCKLRQKLQGPEGRNLTLLDLEINIVDLPRWKLDHKSHSWQKEIKPMCLR